MYKIVACDLDETLLDTNQHKVPERNRTAIRRAKELGVWFVPCSGRGSASMQGTLEELGLAGQPGQYTIGFNGGSIIENTGKTIYFQGISFETARLLFEKSLQYDVCFHIYTDRDVYIRNINPDEEAFLLGRQDYSLFEGKDIDFLEGRLISKVLYQNTDLDLLHRIHAEMEPVIAGESGTDQLSVSYSSNRYIEFNKAGVDKGSGLLRLADLLGVSYDEVIAIGDNNNDISMIRAAGLGCGVANATEETRAFCDFIAESDCDRGGVGEIIEKFILAPAAGSERS